MIVSLHTEEDLMNNYYTASFPQDTKWEMGKWMGCIGLGGSTRSHVTVPTLLGKKYGALLESRVVD
jgi:hypothetical protein